MFKELTIEEATAISGGTLTATPTPTPSRTPTPAPTISVQGLPIPYPNNPILNKIRAAINNAVGGLFGVYKAPYTVNSTQFIHN